MVHVNLVQGRNNRHAGVGDGTQLAPYKREQEQITHFKRHSGAKEWSILFLKLNFTEARDMGLHANDID